jgi:hypothetical protein
VFFFLEITGSKVGELIVHTFRFQAAAFVGLPLEYRPVFLRVPFRYIFFILQLLLRKLGGS